MFAQAKRELIKDGVPELRVTEVAVVLLLHHLPEGRGRGRERGRGKEGGIMVHTLNNGTRTHWVCRRCTCHFSIHHSYLNLMVFEQIGMHVN